MSETAHESDGVFPVEGRIVLFGFDPRPATAFVRPRPRGWRVAGAARTGVVTLLVAPVVGIVPPHVPWVLGALGVGTFLGRRRWHHRFTLESLDATCPKCGGELGVRSGQLRVPHTVACEGCHHEATLEVDPSALAPLEA